MLRGSAGQIPFVDERAGRGVDREAGVGTTLPGVGLDLESEDAAEPAATGDDRQRLGERPSIRLGAGLGDGDGFGMVDQFWSSSFSLFSICP